MTAAEQIQEFHRTAAPFIRVPDHGFHLSPVPLNDWFARRPEDQKRFWIEDRTGAVTSKRAAHAAVFQVNAAPGRLNKDALIYVILREEGCAGEEYRSITAYDNVIDQRADQRHGTTAVLPTDAKYTRDTVYRHKVLLRFATDDVVQPLTTLIGRYLNDPLFVKPPKV